MEDEKIVPEEASQESIFELMFKKLNEIHDNRLKVANEVIVEGKRLFRIPFDDLWFDDASQIETEFQNILDKRSKLSARMRLAIIQLKNLVLYELMGLGKQEGDSPKEDVQNDTDVTGE